MNNELILEPLSTDIAPVQKPEVQPLEIQTMGDLDKWRNSFPAHEQTSPGVADFYQREAHRLQAVARYDRAVQVRRINVAAAVSVGSLFFYAGLTMFGKPSLLTLIAFGGVFAMSFFVSQARSISASRGTTQADTQGPTGPTVGAVEHKTIIINQVVNVSQ